MHHVHIGAGALGLGLIIPAMQLSGLQTTIISRRSDKSSDKCRLLRENLRYELEISGKTESIALRYFFFTEEIRNITFHDDSFIVTISVKDGILDPAFHIFFLDLLESFPRNSKVIVMACENIISSNEFEEYLITSNGSLLNSIKNTKNVIFLDTIVDRICAEPVNGSILKVFVQNDCRFVIETNDNHIKELDSFERLIRSDLHVQKMEKLTLLNLSHLFISIMALDENYVFLDSYLNDTPRGKFIAQNIMEELKDILIINYPDLDEDRLILSSQLYLHRFMRDEDTVHRVLKRFQGPQDIENMCTNMWIKGLNLFEILEEKDFETFPYVSRAIFKLISLISRKHYV